MSTTPESNVVDLPIHAYPPGFRIGIIGGGQLAKMTAMAGVALGCEFYIVEKNRDCPAAAVAKRVVTGDGNSWESLAQLADLVDIITLENEFINAAGLYALEQRGIALFPKAKTLEFVQDKLSQKNVFANAGLPLPRYREVNSKQELAATGRDFGWPVVLKARRNGYDGKGNATVRNESEIDTAWERLGGGSNPLYVEEFCPFESELAIMITRSVTGESVAYPLVHSTQKDHICHIVQAPATLPAEVAERATSIAHRAIEMIDGIGSMGLEMFLTADGKVWVNEVAPRVHNSGHYTIEGCVCSQFENHVRAITGMPLGSTELRAPAVVMVNLLGRGGGMGVPHGMSDAMKIPGVHLHLYGKRQSSVGRKMGHLTVLGQTMDETLAKAKRAADLIHFGDRG